MAQVKVYTTDHCPYCVSAKRLLENKGASFEEINLSSNIDELKALREKTGMRTVPQIFIGEQFIGGFSELSQLDAQGKLDPLLAE